MKADACFCCKIQPRTGELYRSVEVKRGTLRGVYPLCEACHVAVSRAMRAQIASGHTFEVLQNVLVNVQKDVCRREADARESYDLHPSRIRSSFP